MQFGRCFEEFETGTVYKQDGLIVCTFRRRVLVPTSAYAESRGGEQPGGPVPHE